MASSLVLVAWTEAAQNDLKVNTSFLVMIWVGSNLIQKQIAQFRINCNLTQIGDHHKYLLQYAGCACATLLISALYNAGTYRWSSFHLVIIVVSMAAWQHGRNIGLVIFVMAG